MGPIGKLFGKKVPEPSPDAGAYEEAKSTEFEKVLGPMAAIVGHAIIPFQVGGAVDVFYYPNALPGTAFATMEVVEPDGRGPAIGDFGAYEFVAFTRLPFERRESPEFQAIENRLWSIFTAGANYSRVATLGPDQTVEMPGDSEADSNYLILSEFSKPGVTLMVNGLEFRLLLIVEVFRTEMEFARQEGVAALIERLTSAGHYPYSDLDRQPVA